LVPKSALKKEFVDILFFLAKKSQEKIIQHLLNKSQNQSLTANERLTLQALLKKRHNQVVC
jgi:hypothetical protein